jgi:succinoglycan biosynthesis transport protein ExoP
VNSRAQEMLTNNPETTPAKSQLMEQREAAFLELSSLGPSHPARPALEQKIAEINSELKKLDATALEKIRASLRTSEGAKSDATVAQAEASLEQAQRSEQEIQRDLEGQRTGAGSFSAKYSQGVELHDKLEQEQKQLQDIEDRISVLRIERRAPVYVSLDSPALMPDLPQKGGRRKIFALFVLLAIVLSVGVPTGLELIDQRIKTTSELAGVLGFPPLGATMMERGRLAREALRRIALGILQERRASGVRTFVLTPVREVAGTTTLALGLAAELSEFGARTLAIEANPLAPDARYVDTRPEKPPFPRTPKISSARTTTGLARQVAPAALLEARTQAAVKGEGSLPERFSIAQRADGTGLVLESARDIVALALEKYDIVLLDAPPLLASADPLLLMQIPAGVILVVRAERDELAEIRAAAHELERLSPPVVGAVLNMGLVNGSASANGGLVSEPLARTQPSGTGGLIVRKPGFTT